MDPEDAAARTRDAAARLLARRDHTEAELTAKLARTAGAERAAATVARLAEAGLVDDRRFAEDLVSARLAKGYGPERIAYDLRRAGVDFDIAGDVLAAIGPEDLETARRRAVGARLGVEAGRRLIARGFDADDVDVVPLDD
jgi:regulatory protein